MLERVNRIRHSLVSKLILAVGLVLLLSISTWAYFNINFQKKKFMADIVDDLVDIIPRVQHHRIVRSQSDGIGQPVRSDDDIVHKLFLLEIDIKIGPGRY